MSRKLVWRKYPPKDPGMYWFYGKEFGQGDAHVVLVMAALDANGDLGFWVPNGLAIYPELIDEQYWSNYDGNPEKPDKPGVSKDSYVDASWGYR